MTRPTPSVPLVDLAAVADAIDLPATSLDREILHFLDQVAQPGDRERLALGFPLVVRAWQIWHERGTLLTTYELRAQLVAEGLLGHMARA